MQLDFNQPERFDLRVHGGRRISKQQPIMIHRALFGSIERFFAILLEHYAGAFPVWLSPVQVVGIPVAEAYEEYLGDVIASAQGRRCARRARRVERAHAEEDPHAHQAKVPFQLIAGEEDSANGSVSFRFRDGTQENGVPIADAIERIREAIATRAQV